MESLPSTSTQSQMSRETLGLILGLIGVTLFSQTLTATRLAVGTFGAMTVGTGRVLVAAIVAVVYLAARRSAFPVRQWRNLLVVMGGTVYGFPLLSAWSMGRIPASHGAVIWGLQPLATAGAAALRVGERPSRAFWLAGLAGSAVVIAFAVGQASGMPQVGDLAMLGAVITAGFGYADGALMSRTMDPLEVQGWALVLGAPLVAWPAASGILRAAATATPAAWLSLAYVCLISQFFGMWFWYKGLAMGGVAKVGQTQLLQPFFTIIGAAIMLGEPMTWITFGAALLVGLFVALGRRAPVRTAP